jgi:hypothetical protein
MIRSRRSFHGILALFVAVSAATLVADAAKGTAAFTSKKGPVTVTFAHAYLMKGPDVASGKVIRRLVLSATDVSKALAACDKMSCADGGIGDGMTVDFDAGSRLNYWFVANDQLIQYSGTAEPSAAKLSTDSPTHVAGTISLDDTGAGGPKVDVQFDATLVKELKQ